MPICSMTISPAWPTVWTRLWAKCGHGGPERLLGAALNLFYQRGQRENRCAAVHHEHLRCAEHRPAPRDLLECPREAQADLAHFGQPEVIVAEHDRVRHGVRLAAGVSVSARSVSLRG